MSAGSKAKRQSVRYLKTRNFRPKALTHELRVEWRRSQGARQKKTDIPEGRLRHIDRARLVPIPEALKDDTLLVDSVSTYLDFMTTHSYRDAQAAGYETLQDFAADQVHLTVQADLETVGRDDVRRVSTGIIIARNFLAMTIRQ